MLKPFLVCFGYVLFVHQIGGQTIALEHLFQPKHLVERSSLQLRNQLLRSSMNHQFRSIAQSFPTPMERVKQVRRLLQTCTSQSGTQKAVLANLFQSYAQPSMGSSSSNIKGLKVLLDGAPGVGKTTFCHVACKSWADGKIFADFKLMIYIPLREWKLCTPKLLPVVSVLLSLSFFLSLQLSVSLLR